MNNNYDEKYSELRNGLKEFMKNCDRALSANEIKDIISKICPEIRNEIEKETAQEICDFIEENHVLDNDANRWLSWIRKHADDVSGERPVCKDSTGDVQHAQIHNGTPGNVYDMPYACAKEYISRRGLDVPINDGDVFVDERYITQTIANVLRWADNNPVQSQQLSGKCRVENIWKELMTPSVTKLMHIVELAVNNSGCTGCTVTLRQKEEINEYFSLLEQMCLNNGSNAVETLKDAIYCYFNDLYFSDCKIPITEEEVMVFIESEDMWKSAQEAVLKMQKTNNRDALFMTIVNMINKCGDLLFRKQGVSREQCVRFVENFLMKGIREETLYEKTIREFLERLLKNDEFRSVATSEADAELMLKWIRLNP